jgi:hypothetical protein
LGIHSFGGPGADLQNQSLVSGFSLRAKWK